MCTHCRQLRITAAVIDSLREEIHMNPERAAKDHADSGFDCCDGSELTMLHAIWLGLNELGILKEEPPDTDEIYNRVYKAERIRLGYGH